MPRDRWEQEEQRRLARQRYIGFAAGVCASMSTKVIIAIAMASGRLAHVEILGPLALVGLLVAGVLLARSEL
jgi:hypothetical protein